MVKSFISSYTVTFLFILLIFLILNFYLSDVFDRVSGTFDQSYPLSTFGFPFPFKYVGCGDVISINKALSDCSTRFLLKSLLVNIMIWIICYVILVGILYFAKKINNKFANAK
jgi:hypothetical protein